jgi:hypothetical protein
MICNDGSQNNVSFSMQGVRNYEFGNNSLCRGKEGMNSQPTFGTLGRDVQTWHLVRCKQVYARY